MLSTDTRPVSLTLLFGLFWDTGAVSGWWWGVEAAVWSAVGEVGRGGGERRGGRKRVEVEGRGGGGEEGREGKGRRRSRGKQRGDLRRGEEGGSIQLQPAGGRHDTTGQRSRNFSSSLSQRERMGQRPHSCGFSPPRKQDNKETDNNVGLFQFRISKENL